MFFTLKDEVKEISADGVDICSVLRPFLNYFHNRWIRNEGPLNISVYGTSMRITSSLESNNRILNGNVINHINLFTFIHGLRIEEFDKWTNFKDHCESGGKVKEPQDKYKVCK